MTAVQDSVTLKIKLEREDSDNSGRNEINVTSDYLERKVLDDTRTYLSEVWGNRWFDNRKLETRGGMLAISRSRNSKIGGKWNATGRG